MYSKYCSLVFVLKIVGLIVWIKSIPALELSRTLVQRVKGQVLLDFKDIQNQELVVCRSLEATQKPKSVMMKTLDSTLSKREGSKFVSIGKKCADIDAEVVDSLGVSKAILNNVIFCHQEDSCWPLDEGKKVKEKFDAIFNAERYMKCIKLHLDIRKTLHEKYNIIKTEIKHLGDRRSDAVNNRRKIADQERKLSEAQEHIREIEAQMVPLVEEKNKLWQALQEVEQIADKLRNSQRDLENNLKAQKELRQSLEEEFMGTDLELEEKLRNFQMDMDDKVSSFQQLERKVKKLDSEIGFVSREKSQLLMLLGKLRSESEVHEKNKKKLFSDLKNIVAQYELSISIDTEDLARNEVDNVFNELSKKTKAEKERLEKLKQEEEQKINKQHIVIQEIRDEKTSADKEIKLKQDQSNEIEVKKTTIRNRLDEVNQRSGRLDRLEKELAAVTQELSRKENEVDDKLLEVEISNLKEEVQTAIEVENALDIEKSRLHEQSAARAKFDLLSKQLEDKKEKAKRLKAAHENMLLNLLGGEIRDDDLKYQFENCLSKLGSEIQDIEKEIQSASRKLSGLKKEREMLEKQLAGKENDLRKLKQKVNEVTSVDRLEKELTKVKEELSIQQDQKGINDSLNIHYTDFIKKLKQKKCCPLCHRGFPEDNLVDDLIQELKTKISKVPLELEKIGKKIEEYTEKQAKLLTLRPAVEKIKEIEGTELRELKTKLENVEAEIKTLTSTIEEKEDSTSFAKTQEASAKNIQGEVVAFCQFIDEIKKSSAALDKEKSKFGLAKIDSKRTLPVVSSEHANAKRNLEVLQNKKSTLQDKLNRYREEIGKITSRKNALQEDKMKIGQDLQQKQTLEQQLESLSQEASEIEAAVEEKQKQRPTLSRRLLAAENKLSELKKIKDKKIEEATETLSTLQKKNEDLKDLLRIVRSWTDQGRDRELTESEKSLSTVQAKESELSSEKVKQEKLLSQAKSDIDKHKVAERDLQDNARLRQKKSEEKKIRKECESLSQKHRSRNYHNLKSEEDDVSRKLNHLQAELQGNRGIVTTLESSISREKADYEKAYSTIHKEFKEKVFQERVHFHAIEDLNKNRVALEWAIAKFHEEKMRIINKRIKQLWREIYRGVDIDYIMIHTDEIDPTSAGSEKRRQHSYKVVMFKGDVELDMRGRCSAGQKMCASIIIRMALAETFSGSCGVLALDEPTTNLDRDNIESLSRALTSLADRHEGQRNFQLIVITHDETFLETMCRTTYLEHYYRVSRDKKGNSQVRKIPVTQA
ncbi:DNA repair protein RAD50-like isoform X2 [Artemia franciscana]|uniref:DNA repair protein RAD50-like isoform X2 n=1 Tax=Artemia franciscana TaxID=6661 RepID=UPI0032DB176A